MKLLVASFGIVCAAFFTVALLGQDLVYQCPMDPDIRSKTEGVCSRCGMKLKAGIPEPIEFPLDLKVTPRAIKPGQKSGTRIHGARSAEWAADPAFRDRA